MEYMPWIILAIAGLLIVYLMFPRRKAAASGESQEAAARAPNVLLPSRPAEPARWRVEGTAKPTLRERLVHAGFYREGVFALLRVIRFLLLGLIVLGGYLLSVLGLVTLTVGLLIGVMGAVLASIAPSFILDYFKNRRQMLMRRALPDALDIIVVSLEGGLPVAASFMRVTAELAESHPLLAVELTIVQREMQMGRSLGEAISNLAARFDLDDLRYLASVVQQSEQFGASVTRAFSIFADGLRDRRRQRAEELARLASVKLMFPIVLLIFPAMFVVILVPSILRLVEMLRSLTTDNDLRLP